MPRSRRSGSAAAAEAGVGLPLVAQLPALTEQLSVDDLHDLLRRFSV